MNAPQREILHFNDEASWLKARFLDITSTEAASLFGKGRETPFELACRKDGKTESLFKPNERTEIGKEIEHAIAARAARLHGIHIRHKNEYIRVNEWRMGSSFDYEIVGIASDVIDDNRLRLAFGSMGPGLMEVKNVDAWIYKKDWCAGERPEAPSHIEIQLQHQLEVSGLKWGVIVVFIGGNHIEIIIRLRDEGFGLAVRRKVQKFWSDLAQSIYPPVALPDDIDVLKQLYSHAEPGKVLDATGDRVPPGLLGWVEQYIAAAAEEKRAEDRKKTAHGRILEMIGDHEKVLTDIGTISCGLVGPADISYHRKGYRSWRITPKKVKTDE